MFVVGVRARVRAHHTRFTGLDPVPTVGPGLGRETGVEGSGCCRGMTGSVPSASLGMTIKALGMATRRLGMATRRLGMATRRLGMA